ncbi:MAG: cyclin-like protein interacting with PHO85 [Ramalina farinacea]|uniref:Cyclin-like protein interacting with PHO85 n=1 Tax=Ramalina farinacea TaxID=258253 RepID=A0AA43QVN0_9LECA|nr:cyclin-like protein interacting with PHO85 [Ramalina farinacea]
MNITEASIIEAPHSHADLQQYAQHSNTPSTSTSSSASASTSSTAPQTTPPTAVPRAHEAPHIRFRGASTPQRPQHDLARSHDPTPQPQSQEQRHPNIPPPSPRLQPTHPSTVSLNSSLTNSPSRIKVRDLSHIQSFASEEVLTRSRHPSRHSLKGRLESGQQYEISAMPVTDIIDMVAGLLTKITTTNDRLHRQVPTADGAPLTQQASSVLAFHGKNVPTITIASYLTRIHKYCPTTYEVFLSLLVYFDRMTEMVNNGSLSSFPNKEPPAGTAADSQNSTHLRNQDTPMTSPPPTYDYHELSSTTPPSMSPNVSQGDAMDIAHYFVVDSYNIHRLVMAGVTCASKFFSDVFYTNSRYAKVGGLPLVELNHLELQFLLLNDFRLSIPIEELEAYGTMLVEYYASEIVSQQQQQQNQTQATQQGEGIYMHQTPPRP